MINAGADMELRDEQGYSALECAVYCGDQATQGLIEEGLRRKFIAEAQAKPDFTMEALDGVEKKIDHLHYEAFIRKGYRQLVQDTLRPVLLQAQDISALDRLRNEYVTALTSVNKEKVLFDSLKVVYYSDFLASGRIPKFGDGFTREIALNSNGPVGGEFIIFFSYRWIGVFDPAKKSATPDDENNTQYKNMVKALNDFVDAHPRIDRQKLCIWLDYACVDQEDGKFKAAGIVSLPLNLAQCNAMISITDDVYYDRAWCAVEVMMIQALRRSYKFHMWFTFAFDEIQGSRVLREAPTDVEVVMAEKKVTFESVRPILLFLERQTKLLE